MAGGSMRALGRLALVAIGGVLAVGPPSASAAEAPLTRYSIVHGCYSLAPESGGTVAKQGDAYATVGGQAEAFRMQATDLGRYLLYGRDADFLALAGDAIAPATEPSDDADWTVRESGAGFTIVNEHAGKGLGVDGRHAGRGRRRRRRDRFELDRGDRLPAVPGGRDRGRRRSGEGLAGLRRGRRARRRPHARDGVRVPRRAGPLREAVSSLRRPVRASRLPRPRGGQRLRGGARERPLRQPRALPRPGRLADVQGLAPPQVADPRAVLLALARARLARGPAGVREPVRREPRPLRALSAEAEQLQRDGQRAAAGEADPRDAGLHRRPGRRARARASSGSSAARTRRAR